MNKRIAGLALACALSVTALWAQKIGKMEFKNQNIVDILTIITDMAGRSIIIDPSVAGRITFHFGESDYMDALKSFCAASSLFYEERDSVIHVTKVSVKRGTKSDLFSVSATDVDIEQLVRLVAAERAVTILYDSLPKEAITVHLADTSTENFLEVVVKKYPGYDVVAENNAYYIRKPAGNSQATGVRYGSVSIKREAGDLYSVSIPKGSLSAIISQLFKIASLEYSMLNKVDVSLENLYFSGKKFDQLLKLILEQGNCDYVVKDGVYYLFEIQRKDVLKKLKDIEIVQLRYLSATELNSILPAEMNASQFMKVDQANNVVYLTGSGEEVGPIRQFIETIDAPNPHKRYSLFVTKFLTPAEVLAIMPKNSLPPNPVVVPNANAFVAQTSSETEGKIREFIGIVDIKRDAYPVYLKYIQSDALLADLPPSINKEDVVKTRNENMVFFIGSPEKFAAFKKELALIDRPRQQIRYQMLIVQYQKNDGLTWAKSLSATPGKSGGAMSFESGESLLKLNFDVISKLGYSFSAKLSSEITENRARVLADTTLIGLSGEQVSFQNTSTYRYTDQTRDADTNEYSYVTRELTSGIVLKINGWVSGDGMITISVDSRISKQTESDGEGTTTSIPGTSEKGVVTKVRTKSGSSVVIGGLLQMDKTETRKRIPVLGYIPILGLLFQDIITTEETTELVIYITPYLHNDDGVQADMNKNIEGYYLKYVSDKSGKTDE